MNVAVSTGCYRTHHAASEHYQLNDNTQKTSKHVPRGDKCKITCFICDRQLIRTQYRSEAAEKNENVVQSICSTPRLIYRQHVCAI